MGGTGRHSFCRLSFTVSCTVVALQVLLDALLPPFMRRLTDSAIINMKGGGSAALTSPPRGLAVKHAGPAGGGTILLGRKRALGATTRWRRWWCLPSSMRSRRRWMITQLQSLEDPVVAEGDSGVLGPVAAQQELSCTTSHGTNSKGKSPARRIYWLCIQMNVEKRLSGARLPHQRRTRAWCSPSDLHG